MVKITNVIVDRAEGRLDELGARNYKTLAEADGRLRQIARELDEKRGSYKVDVTIQFDDYDTMKSTHRVRHGDIDGDILTHWQRHLTYIMVDPLGWGYNEDKKKEAMKYLDKIMRAAFQ